MMHPLFPAPYAAALHVKEALFLFVMLAIGCGAACDDELLLQLEGFVAEERVNRRLAAILCADVAQYSRLMGNDEEGTLVALKAHRRELVDPLIARHQGRIVKTTGDGLLIEFASVVDAVRCAVVIQSGMEDRNAAIAEERRIRFRVGINVGDIIVEGDDIFGDGVNVAARLEALAQPGQICVSATVRDQIGEKLPIYFADLGEHAVKNIARPIHVFRVDTGLEAAASVASQSVASAGRSSVRASIAVLPFQNMSGDTEQEYFCDGMAEDIITGLARIKWLLVIARNSTFVYKGRAVDIKQVARELAVRYVLEGSVRKGGGRVRITTQLIEAESGTHVWAERYDRPLDDVFAVQDEITLAVVGAIEPSLRQAEVERVRRERPESLGAYDLMLRAMSDLYQAMPETASRALKLIDRALILEPDYALAHGFAAWCHEILFMRQGQKPEDREAGIRHAYTAIARGPDDATALSISAFTLAMISADTPTARKAFEQALAISPSSFFALGFGSVALAWNGDAERAVEWGERAIRISPFDHLIHAPAIGLAVAYLQLGRNDKAAEAARKAIQASPDFSVPHMLLAAALAQAGQIEEAKASAARLLALQPDFTRRTATSAAGAPPSLVQLFSNALEKVGLPD